MHSIPSTNMYVCCAFRQVPYMYDVRFHYSSAIALFIFIFAFLIFAVRFGDLLRSFSFLVVSLFELNVGITRSQSLVIKFCQLHTAGTHTMLIQQIIAFDHVNVPILCCFCCSCCRSISCNVILYHFVVALVFIAILRLFVLLRADFALRRLRCYSSVDWFSFSMSCRVWLEVFQISFDSHSFIFMRIFTHV